MQYYYLGLPQWISSKVAQPTVQETWVQSLDLEDPLEEGMKTHYSILSWRIPWTEESGRLQSIWPHRVTQLKRLRPHTCTINYCFSHCKDSRAFSTLTWKLREIILPIALQGILPLKRPIATKSLPWPRGVFPQKIILKNWPDKPSNWPQKGRRARLKNSVIVGSIKRESSYFDQITTQSYRIL